MPTQHHSLTMQAISAGATDKDNIDDSKLIRLYHVAACMLLRWTQLLQLAQRPLHRWRQLQSTFVVNCQSCWLLLNKSCTSAAATDAACQLACQRPAHTSSRDAELCRSAVSNEALLPCCRWTSTHECLRGLPWKRVVMHGHNSTF